MAALDWTWQAIVGTTTYNLNDGSPFSLLSVTGIGTAPVRRLSERGPQQHGATDLGFRLDPRMINLVLFINAASVSAADTHRDTIATAFKPLTGTPVQLKVTRDDGEVRQIDTYAAGTISMSAVPGERFSATQRIGIQCEAANPVWYDPTVQGITLLNGLSASGFPIPLEIPFVMGGNAGTFNTITYEGNWREYPVIVATGPLTNCIITNTTTSEVLDFTGTTIAAGDAYRIDLRYGAKTVKDNSGTNKIADLSSDSDLATWHLEPDPESAGGLNDISVTATTISTASRVGISYYNRYTHL